MENELFDTQHLAKTYFGLATPVVLGMLVSLVYNLADTWFIAAAGNTMLVAGVSLCSPVFTALMAFGNIYGQGGSSVISRLLGRHDSENTARVSAFCFYIALLTGLVLGGLMLLLRSQLLGLFGATAETVEYAGPYYTILALGAPLIVVNFIHMNLLRCEGMSKQSMYGTVLGSLVNIVLDPIMISGLGWGAVGAAIATVIGYAVSDSFLLLIVLKHSRCLSVDIRQVKISGGFAAQIFGVGITAALSNLMSSAAVILMNRFLLPYGNDRIAAMGIVTKINMIPNMLIIGYAFGGVPLFGYLYGAQRREKLGELMRLVGAFLCGLALLLSAVVFVLAGPLMRLFMENAGIVSLGTLMLRLQVLGNAFAGLVLLMTVLFQASGKVVSSFVMSVSRQGVVYLLALILLKQLAGYTGILIAQAAADLLSAVIGLLLYRFVFLAGQRK